MRLPVAIAACAVAMSAAGAANAASVEIKDAVARVVVIPEDRADVKVEILTTHPDLPLQVRSAGGKWIIDGDLNRRIRDCNATMGRTSVRVANLGEVAYDAMPQVVVRTPRDVRLTAGGAVFGSVGKSASLDFANAGCGDWTLANVTGKLSVSEAGSGDVNAGAAGEAAIQIAGSGDVRTQAVSGRLEVSVAGSGDVGVASVAGAAKIRVAGSGDVRIAAGRAQKMDVTVAGSGDVRMDGEVGDLDARIVGSGDVRVRKVTGAVKKSVMGSGGVTIG